MGARSSDLDMPQYGTNGVKLTGPASGALTFYKGSFVYGIAAGKLANAGQASGDRIVGISTKKQVTTAADQPVEYMVGGTYQFPAMTAVTAADTGANLVMKVATLSDNPADCTSQEDAAAANSDIYIGRIVGWDTGASRAIVCTDGIGFLCTVTTGAWT